MARGPAYPYVNLEEAIDLAQKMYGYSKRSSVIADSVVKEAWKASPTSSSSVKNLAALKYFGLIEDAPTVSGKPDAKFIKITDRAYRIIADSEGSPERKQAIVDAALSPKWYQFCWNKWGKDMPPSMRSTLLFEQHFVETTVDAFIKDYKKTIEFAGLLSGAGDLPQQNKADVDAESSELPTKTGDYVQWESQGVLKFKEPRRVTGFSDDRAFAFVEGSSTGIPSSELIPTKKPVGMPPVEKPPVMQPATRKLLESNDMRHEVFSLTEGAVTIEWPSTLSAESFEDFKDWLRILERKIGRSVSAKSNGTTESQSDPTDDLV